MNISKSTSPKQTRPKWVTSRVLVGLSEKQKAMADELLAHRRSTISDRESKTTVMQAGLEVLYKQTFNK